LGRQAGSKKVSAFKSNTAQHKRGNPGMLLKKQNPKG